MSTLKAFKQQQRSKARAPSGLPFSTGDAKADLHTAMLYSRLPLHEQPDGMTPFCYLAMLPSDVLSSLIKNMRDDGVSEQALKTLINMKDLDTTRVGGYTPLHRACQAGEVETVKLLLSEGADPNATKNNNSTPLMTAVCARSMAIKMGNTPKDPEKYLACAKLLFSHCGFDREINDNEAAKCLPVWAAVSVEILEENADANLMPMLKFLLSQGCNPNCELNGQTPLHLAVRNGYLGCAHTLVLGGADVMKTCVPCHDAVPSSHPDVTPLQLCRFVHGPQAVAALEAAAKVEPCAPEEVEGPEGAEGLEELFDQMLAGRRGVVDVCVCGARGTLTCTRCKARKYCSGACQKADWKAHKPTCHSDAQTAANIQEQLGACRKNIKAAKKAGHPVMTLSPTHAGMVGPGMPVPAGVPANFGLKQQAHMAFITPAPPKSEEDRGNMKGEREFKEYFEELCENSVEWMGFFDHQANYEHAEHTCGILGTLATIYRQRGVLADCTNVLDMEEKVLERYQRAVELAENEPAQFRHIDLPGMRRCFDALTYKYNIIRYNVNVDEKNYSRCVPLFRKNCLHELKYNYNFDQQNFLFTLPVFAKRRPNRNGYGQMTDEEVMKCVMGPVNAVGHDGPHQEMQRKKTALNKCEHCDRTEEYMEQFKKAGCCRKVYYCSTECSKLDWKKHKKECTK